MDFLPLLRISARLLDLHDAERSPGNSPVFSQEERRGLRDGRYLDLAAAVLEGLRANAHESGNAFIGFDALLIGIRQDRSDVDADDLRYALNVLSRSTELWSIHRDDGVPRLVSDKASELVEKTFFADDYRLAPAGRAAIAVAGNIQSFAYAEGDVLKLLRAIEAGDFSRVPVFCATILDTIRYESVDLRQVIEKGFIDQQSALYRDQLPRYRQVIKHSSELLRQADAKLKAWRAPDNDALDESIDVDVFDLEQHVLRVYQALEAFGRDLAELTALAAQRRASVVAPPDFLDAALRLVKGPPADGSLRYFYRQFGPLSMDGMYPSPMDTAGKVRVAAERTVQSARFETAGAAAMARDTQLIFLGEFGDAIRERLSQGPLSLADALDKGRCQLEGEPALGELLGVYVAPWSLGTASAVEIRIPPRLTGHDHPAVGDVIFSNLELALQGGGNAG